jgi:hypothetical protein
VARRALPALLALTALAADLSGNHALALGLLFAAIPAAFALTLDCYGDALAAQCGLTRPLLAGGALACLVLSATLRSPAVVGGVPRLAISAIVLSLLLYATVVVAALFSVQSTPPVAVEEAEVERLAA